MSDSPPPIIFDINWDEDEVADPLIDPDGLERALLTVLAAHGRSRGQLSVAIIGDATMHRLNREQLDHDYTTDVLSFNYGEDSATETIDGEVIVNADHAVRSGPEHGLSAANELLLYCIHGTLHILGYDDVEDADRERMHAVQAEWLKRVTDGSA